MRQALLDTDTISYFLRKHPTVLEKVEKYVEEHGSITISVVTYYEVLNGLLAKDAQKQLTQFESLLALVTVFPVTMLGANIAANICAEMRRTGRMIGHNDILIAGTAIENDLILITNNTKHFSLVKGLEIDNWKI